MPRADDLHNAELQVPTREISWSAIFAGALVALSLSFLVHTINAGIGLSAFTTSPSGMLTLGIGAMFWLIIIGIITMFIAGYVAGRIGRRLNPSPYAGVLHGFLAWSLALLIGLFLATNVLSGFVSNSPQAEGAVQQLTKAASSEKARDLTPSKHTENIAETAGVGALATFFVFLFGAVASGVGGYYGATRYRRW